jgi:hypothetical protein
MADYDESKSFGTNVYPVESSDTSNLFGRAEPLLTPAKLKSKYLKGIDELFEYTNADLKNEIDYAMNEFEVESKLFVTKVQFKERIPFDRNLYKKFVYIKTNNGPILSVEDLSVVSSNGEKIFRLPPTWLEVGLAHKRQINLMPILTIFGANGLLDGQPSNAGLIFIQAINNYQWLPAFWTITYTCGLSHIEGQVPKIVNDIIGMTAAIEILGVLQNKIKYTSTSVSQDSISQSASGLGPQTYKLRIDMLESKRAKLMGQVKAKFHQRYFLSNI